MRLHFSNTSLNRKPKKTHYHQNKQINKQANKLNLLGMPMFYFPLGKFFFFEKITLSKNQPLQTEQLIFQKIKSSI